ncbi:MAG: nitroreductase [Minisyncoccia bacterium]
MKLDEAIKKRRSTRKYLDRKVSKDDVLALIEAAVEAPSSCNLQVTQFVAVLDEGLIKRLREEVSYKFGYAPCYIFVLYDKNFSKKRSAGVMSAGMSTENIMLKALDLGLSTCPFAGFEKDSLIKEILGIPRDLEILLFISVGYEDKSILITPKARIPAEKLVSFNRYDKENLKRLVNKTGKLTLEEFLEYRRRIGPVYLDRFRLNTLNPKYYKDLASFVLGLNFTENRPKLFDLISYDGAFIKSLTDIDTAKNFDITASDFLPFHLEFFEKKLGVKTAKIEESGVIKVSDNFFDIVTCAFEYQFVPDAETFVFEAAKKIKGGGFILIAIFEQSFVRRLRNFLGRTLREFLSGRKFNIYELNPFYRSGLWQNKSTKNLEHRLKEARFIRRKIEAPASHDFGIRPRYFLFERTR